jgi:hypothetical protein
VSNIFKDYKRLVNPMFEDAAAPYMGGQADMTPMRNRAREAMDALADAQRAADQGRVDDCMEGFRRAKAAIDAALGGQIGPASPQPPQMPPATRP